MPTTRGQFQVPYREHVYGYREEFAPQIGPQVTRVLDVRWNRAGEFVWDLLGWVEYESGSLLRRYLPEVLDSFADSNGNPVLYAVDARLVQSLGEPGIDEDTETLVVWDKEPHEDPPTDPEDDDYGWARYEVTYRPRTYRVLPDGEVSSELERFVTRTETYAATNYTIPGGVFVLEHAPTIVLPENLTKTEFLEELTYVWHHIPLDHQGRLPVALRNNIRRCVGRTNLNSFDDEHGPDELLCMSPHIEPYHSPHGDRVADIHFKFLRRQSTPDSGWNTTFWRGPSGPGFYRIHARDNPALLLYPREGFELLFSME